MYFSVVFSPPLYLKMWLKNLSFFSLHYRFKWLRTGASHASQGCYYLPVTFLLMDLPVNYEPHREKYGGQGVC